MHKKYLNKEQPSESHQRSKATSNKYQEEVAGSHQIKKVYNDLARDQRRKKEERVETCGWTHFGGLNLKSGNITNEPNKAMPRNIQASLTCTNSWVMMGTTYVQSGLPSSILGCGRKDYNNNNNQSSSSSSSSQQ